MAKFLRLTRSKDFRRVYDEGTSHVDRLAVLHSLQTNGESRIGFTVSRKLGKAVTRNRIKRRLREATRRLEEIPEGFDFVVSARARAKDAEFSDLQETLERLFAKARQEKVRERDVN